jgi:hypothetical protein
MTPFWGFDGWYEDTLKWEHVYFWHIFDLPLGIECDVVALIALQYSCVCLEFGVGRHMFIDHITSRVLKNSQ